MKFPAITLGLVILLAAVYLVGVKWPGLGRKVIGGA